MKELVVRQIAEPEWKCIRDDDNPVPCDRCSCISYVYWTVSERADKQFRPFVGTRLCTDCMAADDFEPDSFQGYQSQSNGALRARD